MRIQVKSILFLSVIAALGTSLPSGRAQEDDKEDQKKEVYLVIDGVTFSSPNIKALVSGGEMVAEVITDPVGNSPPAYIVLDKKKK